MLPVGISRGGRCALALVVVLPLLMSCGGGDGGEGDRPAISPTRTPTASLPTPELPTITRSEPTASPELPTITRSEPTSSPDEPTTQETSDPAEQPTSESVAPPSAGTDESGEQSAQGSADDDVPPWVWWLLAALVLASAVAIPLIVRARRRNAWQRDLGGVEAELAWFARVLLPELRQVGSREQVAGGWAVGEPRVAAAEDRLTALEPTAPDDAGRRRALSLRDASRQARARMAQLTGPGPNNTWALDLDAIIADLEAALQSKMEA